MPVFVAASQLIAPVLEDKYDSVLATVCLSQRHQLEVFGARARAGWLHVEEKVAERFGAVWSALVGRSLFCLVFSPSFFC